MSAVLLLKSKSRWRLGTALGVAAALHLAAIALAGIEPHEQPVTLPGDPEVIGFNLDDPIEDPTPEIDQTPPLNPVDQPDFVDETQPPPPRPSVKRDAPRRGITHASSMGTTANAKAMVLWAPRPIYPYPALRGKITGNGVALIRVDSATGNVTQVVMSKTTGNTLLDAATIEGLRKWRFRTGTPSRVVCPITYTLAGAAF